MASLPLVAAGVQRHGGGHDVDGPPGTSIPTTSREDVMTTAIIPTRTSTTERTTDWYAVSLPCERRDRYATFREVSLALATPIDDEDRARRSLAVAMLARAAGRAELASRPDDPDVVRHRTAARVLAQYARTPGHPALDEARRMLATAPAA